MKWPVRSLTFLLHLIIGAIFEQNFFSPSPLGHKNLQAVVASKSEMSANTLTQEVTGTMK